MTMETDGDSPPPIWSHLDPSTTAILQARRRRSQPSLIVNPVVLILIIPFLTITIIFFLVPKFISYASPILQLQPTYSLKASWDSFSVALVLVAVLCGLFAKRNDDFSGGIDLRNRNAPTSSNVSVPQSVNVSVSSSSSDQWFDSFSNPVVLPEPKISGKQLRRSSVSYPDLQREDLWETGNNSSRLSDGNFPRSRSSENFQRRSRRKQAEKVIQVDSPEKLHRRSMRKQALKDSDSKVIHVDKFESFSAPPPHSPLPPPPLASLKQSDPVEKAEVETNESQVPLPPPPEPALSDSLEETHENIHRKKTSKQEFATAIVSFYNQTKRKKRGETRNIHCNVAQSSPPPVESVIAPPTPPPPPPPPPPSKVFQNLFKKNSKNIRVNSMSTSTPPIPPPSSIFNNIFKTSSKSKRINSHTSSSSVPTPPPPPPPPPPLPSILNTLFKTGNKSNRFETVYSSTYPPTELAEPHSPKQIQQPTKTPRRRDGRPPLPVKSSRYYDEYFHPTPPLPPPPPFEMQEIEFVSCGDFVKIGSSPAPELEDVDMVSFESNDTNPMDGDDIVRPDPDQGLAMFHPSPDVNVKADNFIARLKDEWRCELMGIPSPKP